MKPELYPHQTKLLEGLNLNRRIDLIQTDSEGLSAEARNVLHACRPDHPLGNGKSARQRLDNAAFVLSGKVRGEHVEWLIKMARKYEEKR